MIRLVATDLDETLLEKDKTIPEDAIRKFRQLADAGVLFTFVTGRPPAGVTRFTRMLQPTAPIVYCNGGLICDRDRVLHEESFSLAMLQDLLQEAVARQLTCLIFDGETEYALSETPWTRERQAEHRPVPIRALERFYDPEPERAVKVTLMDPRQSGAVNDLRPCLERLKSTFNVIDYGLNGFEFADKVTDKGAGLKVLCDLLDIPLREALAVGDNANDMGLIREAGIGVAVANATKSLQEIADYVTRAPRSRGVIEAIDRFVTGRSQCF